jgi:hypothetical protein
MDPTGGSHRRVREADREALARPVRVSGFPEVPGLVPALTGR